MLNQQSTIFISGASDGLGKALAFAIARTQTCHLAISGRDEDKLKNVLREILEINPKMDVLVGNFDASDEVACAQFADHLLKIFGHIDILVNNAGANVRKAKVEEIKIEELKYMFQLNCISHLVFIQKFLPGMKQKKDGFIMNILSSCCQYDMITMGAYTASKQAMNALHKALVKEVREDNIKVSAIYPGGINTNFREIEREDYLDPVKLANVLLDIINLEDGVVHDLVLRPMVESNF